MGPQPGSNALLAEENLRARARGSPDDLRRSTDCVPSPPRVPHENGEPAMKMEFSCVRETRDGSINRQL